MLTENIRWVTSVTLEGDRLTADNVVVRRNAVIGARLDLPGWRFSFVGASIVLLVSLAGAVSAFAQTLQFFDPDYTMFAASLIPVILSALVVFWVRPRKHLTILCQDGSALVLVSADVAFLRLCLEAFERLWLDEARRKTSLYLHAGHRSVDFGPTGLTDLAVDQQKNQNNSDAEVSTPALPPLPELPVFGADEDVSSDPMGEDVDQSDNEQADKPAMDQGGADDAPTLDPQEDEDAEGGLADDDSAGPAPGPLIPASQFAGVLSNVTTLSRLLRQRSSSPALVDAISILEDRTQHGCATEREARALARSVAILRSRMAVYPAAVQVLDLVFAAGALDRFSEASLEDDG